MGLLKLILIIALAIMPQLVSGAIIHGIVYDFSLNPADEVIVEINTIPNQQIVAKNSSYSFNVPEGSYVLKASQRGTDAKAEETVTIETDGDYVVDLILFPGFEEEFELLNETESEPETGLLEESGASYYLVGIIAIITILILAISLIVILKMAKRKSTMADSETAKGDVQEVIDFIKKEGGRASQKEIRKHSPLSEAKVSLIISELEHRGVVEKIKRGRGNIIVLK